MIDFLKEEQEMRKLVQYFEEELKSMRTGRAHISMVENIPIEVYGTHTPLSHIASIALSDPRSIIIKPWDKTNLPMIEQALIRAHLGAQPIAEKEQIRLALPPPTEERRRETVKLLKKKKEETHIAIRRKRDDIWKAIQQEERDGIVSEDQKFSQKERMEKLVENIYKEVDHSASKKEKDIMEF